MDKDKIIIVVRAGVGDMGSEESYHFLKECSRAIGNFDESIIKLIAPDRDFQGIRIECINPKLVSDAEYAGVEEKLDELIKKSNEFLAGIREEEED